MTIVNTKTTVLRDQFYLEVDTDLANITDINFIDKERLSFKQTITEDKICIVLKKTKPDKCSEVDKISNQFLKAIEDLLV